MSAMDETYLELYLQHFIVVQESDPTLELAVHVFPRTKSKHFDDCLTYVCISLTSSSKLITNSIQYSLQITRK